jgi:3-methyladenine DNA glycosylase AlkD
MGSLAEEIIGKLNEMAEADCSANESRLGQLDIYGIRNMRFLDIPHDKLLEIARETGRPRQDLAMELWNSDHYEARILSCMLSDPGEITGEQADAIAGSLDSWILCEYFCGNVLWRIPSAMKKAVEWADSGDETLMCTGFSLIAAIAAHTEADSVDEPGFFDNALFLARKRASDLSASVLRAVSSALTTIGKMSRDWHEAAVETAGEIAAQPSESARWVASQTLGELKSSRVTGALKGE